MNGVPYIRNLRIPVATIVAMVADGMTEEEILNGYPDLEPEDIQQSLKYTAEADRERSSQRQRDREIFRPVQKVTNWNVCTANQQTNHKHNSRKRIERPLQWI